MGSVDAALLKDKLNKKPFNILHNLRIISYYIKYQIVNLRLGTCQLTYVVKTMSFVH